MKLLRAKLGGLMLLGLWLLGAAWSHAQSGNPYVLFVTKDQRYINGVPLRTIADRWYIATANEIVELRSVDVASSGRLTPEALRLVELLDISDSIIASAEFDRATANLPALDRALAAYREALQSRLASSTTPETQRQALLRAIAYYEAKRAEIEPTVTILGLAAKVNVLDRDIFTGAARRSPELLDVLGDLSGQLHKLPPGTTSAEKERKKANGQLATLLQNTTKDLRQQALAELRQNSQTGPVLQLAANLSRNRARSPEFGPPLLELVSQAAGIVGDLRQKLPERTDAALAFGPPEGLTLNENDYENYRRLLVGMADFLDRLGNFCADESGEKARQALSTERSAIAQTLAAAAERMQHFSRFKDAYTQAVALQNKGSYAPAARAFLELEKRFAELALAPRDLVIDLGLRRRECETRDLYAQLSAPEGRSLDELQRLDDLGKQHLAANSSWMSNFEVNVAAFAKALRGTRNYRQFLVGMGNIGALREGDPVKALDFVNQMNDWLGKVKEGLGTQAHEQWRRWQDAHMSRLIEEAANELLSQPGVFSGSDEAGRKEAARRFQLFQQCVENYVTNKDLVPALKLTERAAALISPERDQSVARDLIAMQLHLADVFAERGEYDRVSEVFAFIARHFPDLQQASNVQVRVAELFYQRAKNLQAGGQTEEAASLLARVCREYPHYATRNALYNELLGLELGRAKISPREVSGDALRLLDRFCREYPGRCRNLEGGEQLRQALLDRLRKDWSGQPREAVASFLATIRDHGDFAREANLVEAFYGELLRLANDTRTANRPVPPVTLEALRLCLRPEMAKEPGYPRLQRSYVALAVRQAEQFVAANQVARAYDAYLAINQRFPALAAEMDIPARLHEHEMARNLDLVKEPMRVRSMADWAALACWPLFFLLTLCRAIWVGRRENELGSYLAHYLFSVLAFAVLLSLFLFSSIGHLPATVVAFAIPAALFNGFGLCTFHYFPRLHVRRRMWLERLVLPLAAPLGLRDLLEMDLLRLERDLTLLRDMRLFRLQQAQRTAALNAQRGYPLLLESIGELRLEKSKDPSLTEPYAEAVGLAGSLAFQLGDKERAQALLREHLDYAPKDVRTREQLGSLLFEAGDFEGAIPHLKVCLAAHGSDDELWARLGRCFFATGKFLAAYKCFNAIQTPTRDALFHGALSYAHCNEFEPALEWFSRLRRDYPDDHEATYQQAALLARFGRDDEARQTVVEIPADSPFFVRGLALRGSLAHRSNDPTAAEQHFDQALASDPHFVPALLGKGQIRQQNGDHESANRLFAEALHADPANPAANYFAGVLCERQDPQRAAVYLEKAMTAPRLRRAAASRLGRVHFLGHNYDAAQAFFRLAEEEGEVSPWFLYLYAYSLVMHQEAPRCEQILVKIFGRQAPGESWQQHSTNAMYTLGVRLNEHGYYKLAHQCLDLVIRQLQDRRQQEQLTALVEEMRFRMVVEQLAKGDYLDAQNELAMLQLETSNRVRFLICQYYQALCQILIKEYADAERMLTALLKSDQDPAHRRLQARYRYHLLLARLGQGRTEDAEEMLAALRENQSLPAHLRAGLGTVRAFISAREGKFNRAEQLLNKIDELSEDFPGIKAVRQKILLARIYYSCMMNDTARLQELIAELSERERGLGAYYHALAAIVTQETESAFQILQPYAGQSDRNRRLFLYLATHLAQQALLAERVDAAGKYLQDLDEPPPVRQVKLALEASHEFDRFDLEDPESLAKAIRILQGYANQLGEKHLAHSLVHSLAVLYLRRAYLLEEAGGGDEECHQAWLACIQFWFKNLLSNREYWTIEQERFAPLGQVGRPFTNNEIDTINQKLKIDTLLEFSRGYIIACVDAGDRAGIERHMAILQLFGQQDGFLKNYVLKLSEDIDSYLKRSGERRDGQYDNWDYVIGLLNLRVTVNDLLGNRDEALLGRLRMFAEIRERFPSPSAFYDHRRKFFTNLLMALQKGISGSFSDAGGLLENCLRDIPAGVDLSEFEAPLRLLREACRRPQGEGGRNLVVDFEKLYRRIRQADLTKGSEDGTSF